MSEKSKKKSKLRLMKKRAIMARQKKHKTKQKSKTLPRCPHCNMENPIILVWIYCMRGEWNVMPELDDMKAYLKHNNSWWVDLDDKYAIDTCMHCHEAIS